MGQALQEIAQQQHHDVSWLLLSPPYRAGDRSGEVSHSLPRALLWTGVCRTQALCPNPAFPAIGKRRKGGDGEGPHAFSFTAPSRAFSSPQSRYCHRVIPEEPENDTSSGNVPLGHKASLTHLPCRLPFREQREWHLLRSSFQELKTFCWSYPRTTSAHFRIWGRASGGQATRPPATRSCTRGPLPLGWWHRMLL